jgi:hypothetical protein
MSARTPQKGQKKKKSSKGKKARFLDFNIHTQQHNSGIQQYGAGLKNDSGRARNSTVPTNIGRMPRREVHMGPSRAHIIRERESLGAVSASLNFSTRSWTIQPGMLFPWGSTVASQYERYRFRKMNITFEPTVSGFAAEGSHGRLALSCDYDSLEGPPSTMVRAEAMDPHMVGMPYTPFTLRLDPHRLTESTKLIRTGPVADSSINFDAGNFHFTAQGGSDADVGELFVDYEIELMNPRIGETTLKACTKVKTFHGGTNGTLLSGLVSPLNVTWHEGQGTGDVNSPAAFNPGCLEISPPTTSSTWTLPKGTYRINVNATASHVALTNFNLILAHGSDLLNPFGSKNGTYDGTPTAFLRNLSAIGELIVAHGDEDAVFSLSYWCVTSTGASAALAQIQLQIEYLG